MMYFCIKMFFKILKACICQVISVTFVCILKFSIFLFYICHLNSANLSNWMGRKGLSTFYPAQKINKKCRRGDSDASETFRKTKLLRNRTRGEPVLGATKSNISNYERAQYLRVRHLRFFMRRDVTMT